MAQVDAPVESVALQEYFSTEETWAAFWMTHHTAVLDAARRVLGKQADAEDAVQNALTELLRIGKSGRTIEVQKETVEESIAAFFSAIVRRRALDIWREQRRIAAIKKGLAKEDMINSPAAIHAREPLVFINLERLRSKLPAMERQLFNSIAQHQATGQGLHRYQWFRERGLADNKNAHDEYDQLKKRLRARLRELGVH